MKSIYPVLLGMCCLFLLFGCASDSTEKTPIKEVKKAEPVLTEAQQFFKNLSTYCGKAYRGKLTYSNQPDFFKGKPFIAFFEYCNDKEISVPFSMGEDKSQTWKITPTADGIQFKIDVRKDDGNPKKITLFGGECKNGSATSQIFPADATTKEMIPKAAKNEWVLKLNEEANTLNYLILRAGKKRFGVEFDLSKPQAI